MTQQQWRLVRTIVLEPVEEDVTVLQDGFTDASLDEMKHWNGDALNLSGVDAYEGVLIRLDDQGIDIAMVERVLFTLQFVNPTSNAWEDLCEVEPSGERYESTGDALADYARSRALDDGENYR